MTLPIELTATEVAHRVRAGTLTATQVAMAVLARIDARGDDVRAFAYLDAAELLGRAAMLDATTTKGSLHGVPVAGKDVINTKDMPTSHHTPRYAGSRPGLDAACVDTLRAAGALLVGKTVTTEFATTDVGGPTRNPLDLTRTPGGSSSGSAAAVADFQSTIGLGTQTGGSTIRPASFTGVYGWKPTWNSISREGLKMYSATCDTLGLYARSAQDLALIADVFDLDPPETPVRTTMDGARIAVVRSPVWFRASPATRTALAAGADRLRDAGAIVVELPLPKMFDGLPGAHRTILAKEGHSAFLNEYRNTPDLADPFCAIVENRLQLSPSDYRAAYRLADACRSAFDDLAADFDAILTPSTTGEAPVGIESTGDPSFNSIWTLLQVPVVNVPGFLGPAGMPVGLSLVTRRYQDRAVIALAGLAGRLFEGTGRGPTSEREARTGP